MPTMAVLKHLHPMIGSDFHDEIAPPGVPVPNIPHFVAGMLSVPPWGVATNTDKINGTVWTTVGMSMTQGCDMGFFIPHIPLPPAPANILAPILSLASGSKSHFGAHNHKTKNGPLAFACLKVVNLNLNCGGATRPPLPSGFVMAFFQTTWQGVTWGDLIAGALHMAVDIFVQFRINKFFANGLGAKALNFLMGRVASAIAARTAAMGVRLSTLGVHAVGDLVLALMDGRAGRFVLGYGLAEQLPAILAATGLGTPIGYSPGFVPTTKGEGLADRAQDSVADSIDHMFDSPAVEQHPSAPPADAGAPTAAGADGADAGADAAPDAAPDASMSPGISGSDASVGPQMSADPSSASDDTTGDAGAPPSISQPSSTPSPEPSSSSSDGPANSSADPASNVCGPDGEDDSSH